MKPAFSPMRFNVLLALSPASAKTCCSANRSVASELLNRNFDNRVTNLFYPEAMALGPCPGMGQLVGSVMRAAGFAMCDFLSSDLLGPAVSDLRLWMSDGDVPSAGRPSKQQNLDVFKRSSLTLLRPYTTLRHPLHLRQNPPACASSTRALSFLGH